MVEQKKNIVLIGMMGCGKSTIGRALSYKLKMPYVDLDQWLEKRTGRTIPNIFAEDGEAGFREIEHAIVQEAAGWHGTILSTGGGVVLREDNMRLLRESGLVVFIDRPVEEIIRKINVKKRPILAQGGKEKLYQLKRERYALYRKYAHLRVVNRGTFSEGVENTYHKIKRALRRQGRKHSHA